MPAAGSGRTRKAAAGGRGGRQKKVPRTGPKKALTAYLLYDRTRREQLVKERPELRSNVTEMSKIIGAEWRQMSDEQKAPFQREHEKDKERYIREKKEFENSQQLKALGVPSDSQEVPASKPSPAEGRQKRPAQASGFSNEEEEEEKRFDEEDEEDEADEIHTLTEGVKVGSPEGHGGGSSHSLDDEESGEQSGSPAVATVQGSPLGHGTQIASTASEKRKPISSSFTSTQPAKHSAAPYPSSPTESGSESVVLSPPPSKRFRPSTNETDDDNGCQLQDATQTACVDASRSPGNTATDMEPYVAAA